MAINIKQPPETKAERISRLVTRIEQGDIKIPVFQREFVWKPIQVLELLDSIYQGYPIGSLLFWLTNEKLATERNIGSFRLPETPERYPTNYILDGQQRLTAIYGVLHWSGDNTESPFNVCFDLESERFVPTPVVIPPTYVPMRILFQTREFRQFQQALPDDALLEKSDALLETFREYAIPVVAVTEPTVDDVSIIFERINSTGTKLTVFDLMVAATWSQAFDLREEIEDALDGLSGKGFEDISPVAILQVLSAHVAESAKRESILQLRRRNSNELISRMQEVKEALRRAVDFLSDELHVKSSDFLPYERQLVALAFVFARRNRLTATQVGNLRKWFWRTSFSERYRRGGEGLFDEDLSRVLRAIDSPGELLTFGLPPRVEDFELAEFRKNSALTSAVIALLASTGPRNLLNGSAIDTRQALSKYNRKEFHHIFPYAYLVSEGVYSGAANSIANICMLSSDQNKAIGRTRPSTYVRNIQETLGFDFESVLRTNLIPPDAVPHLLNDDYPRFLAARSRAIVDLVIELLGDQGEE